MADKIQNNGIQRKLNTDNDKQLPTNRRICLFVLFLIRRHRQNEKKLHLKRKYVICCLKFKYTTNGINK